MPLIMYSNIASWVSSGFLHREWVYRLTLCNSDAISNFLEFQFPPPRNPPRAPGAVAVHRLMTPVMTHDDALLCSSASHLLQPDSRRQR